MYYILLKKCVSVNYICKLNQKKCSGKIWFENLLKVHYILLHFTFARYTMVPLLLLMMSRTFFFLRSDQSRYNMYMIGVFDQLFPWFVWQKTPKNHSLTMKNGIKTTITCLKSNDEICIKMVVTYNACVNLIVC